MREHKKVQRAQHRRNGRTVTILLAWDLVNTSMETHENDK